MWEQGRLGGVPQVVAVSLGIVPLRSCCLLNQPLDRLNSCCPDAAAATLSAPEPAPPDLPRSAPDAARLFHSQREAPKLSPTRSRLGASRLETRTPADISP